VSRAYERDLVSVESSGFERLSAGVVVAAFLTVVLAVATLFGWVPAGQSVGRAPLLSSFGVAMLAMGASVLGLGVTSRAGLFETDPDQYSGLVGGGFFGLLWFVGAGLLAANTVGLGGRAWYTVAPMVGLAALAGTVLLREDLGATLPVGVPVVAAGSAVVSGLVSPGWAWSPAGLSATVPAHVAVPVLAVCCSLLCGWTAGKAYSGFGTRGRQTGAYLLVSLVVYAVLGVLVILVAFIAARGLAPVLENLRVGATAGLLVACVALVFVGSGSTPGAVTSGGGVTARTLTRLGVLCVFGLSALVCLGVLVAGQPVSWGGVTVAPVGRIGTGVAVLALATLTLFVWSRHDGGSRLRTPRTVPRRVRVGLLVVGLGLASLAGVGLFTSVADPVLGLALTPLASGLAVGLAVYPTALLLWRLLTGRNVADGSVAPVSELRLGVAGSLAFLAVAVALEVASGLVAVGSPGLPVGSRLVAVSLGAQVVAASLLVYAVAVAVADREAALEYGQTTLAGVGVLGALTVLVCHAIATFNELVVFGLVTVSPFGAFDWPFLMNPSQGLGIQTGVMPAVIGTVWLVGGAVLMAVPLAVGAAVYLTEYADEGLVTRGVEIATNGLWSTPSIVFGLFGLAFIVPRFGNSPSLFAGQLVLSFMLLPLVLITSREAMKAVPDEYRDASAALGVSKWQTIRSVVVPAAMPGVITGVILGVGRIAGETAPLIIVLRGANFPSQGPGVLGSFDVSLGLQPPFVHVANPALLDRASALPFQLYAVITAGVGENQDFAWGTALVLLGVVLSFYAVGIVSRRYFRRKLEQ
jgi:phosphate transport system permease protein